MKTVPLGEVAEVNPRAPQVDADDDVSFVGMAQLDATMAKTDAGVTRRFDEVSKGYTVFRNSDILVAKITPCFENNKIGQAHLQHAVGVGSTEFHVVRPGELLDRRYVLHYLRQDRIRAQGELRMTGSAGQRRVPTTYLEQLPIPLPPLAEQLRIAAILDYADALRAKRRQVITHLDQLAQAIFHDMFGDEASRVRFSSVVVAMRNGLSPSNTGTAPGRVLTLSAITQGSFDPSASKEAMFARDPDINVRVQADDFLICRGNGNQALVGVGVHPPEDRPDLVFPDTVIAARIDKEQVDPGYLELAWAQPGVRTQIESSARTTNGTHKVNQQGLRDIEIPLPSIAEQRRFAERMAAIPRVGVRNLDELFASLQSRAFSGVL